MGAWAVAPGRLRDRCVLRGRGPVTGRVIGGCGVIGRIGLSCWWPTEVSISEVQEEPCGIDSSGNRRGVANTPKNTETGRGTEKATIGGKT